MMTNASSSNFHCVQRNNPGRSSRVDRDIDLNLLVALDVLLAERSVSAAADRLGLSAPAMSRTLGRIRVALGDPILVRSGRAMVPTPRALEIHAEVGALLDRAGALFAGDGPLDPSGLDRSFTVIAGDLIAASLTARLLPRLREAAPGVRLVLLPEGHTSLPVLRDGAADVELGVITAPQPETRVELLFTDVMVSVVRPGHPLTVGSPTPGSFARADHVTTSRRGRLRGPVDDALEARGLRRRVVAALPTHAGTALLVAGSDLVGLATERLGAPLIRAFGLVSVPVPLPLPPLDISMAWHPRHEADPAHRWFRAQVRAALGE